MLSHPPHHQKHIELSIKIKRIVNACRPDWRVYLATHTGGQYGQSYQLVEQESGEEFWSIRGLSVPERVRLKDPDAIVTYGNEVKFLVEIKWGAVVGRLTTDLFWILKEREKLDRLLTGPAECRVGGPAVKDGRRYRSAEFPTRRVFRIGSYTKLVLVTDLAATEQTLGAVSQGLTGLQKSFGSTLLIANIDAHIGGIPSFQELLEKQFSP